MPDFWNEYCQGNSTKTDAISIVLTCLLLRLDFVVGRKEILTEWIQLLRLDSNGQLYFEICRVGPCQ